MALKSGLAITPSSYSRTRQQLAPRHEQIREGSNHFDLAAVLGQAAQPGLLKTELLLDHSEGMLGLGADVSLGSCDPILKPPSGVLGRTLRMTGRISTLNSIVLYAI